MVYSGGYASGVWRQTCQGNQLSDAMNGKAQIALLRIEPGVYCKKNTEKMQDCQCKELEALVARVAPRVVTSSNFSSKYALFKTTAYVCYVMVETKNG